jgi:hypothetical protein
VWQRLEEFFAGALERGQILLNLLSRLSVFVLHLLWIVLRWVLRIFVLILIVYVLAFAVFDTAVSVTYRYSPPTSNSCTVQHKLAADLDLYKNDELEALEGDDELRSSNGLTCMLQLHELHANTASATASSPPSQNNNPLQYHLAFLEFGQDGTFPSLNADGTSSVNEQLNALKTHLASQHNDHKQNFVLVFIHGWRHDASIGDDNVQNTRLYAAYLTSFLNYRCKTKHRYCNATVTAVYVGWRGARVNENGLKRLFRTWYGEIIGLPFYLPDLLLGQEKGVFVGTGLALPTLFDRKPVSERIAPSILSALQQIDDQMQGWNAGVNRVDQERMIIFGHSLGGNILASALKERMITEIRRHQAGTIMKPPIGNLVVLINPASEAENWVALQRETRERANLDAELDKLDDANEEEAAQRLYPPDQPPIYIALTSASSWPAGKIRDSDLQAMRNQALLRQAHKAAVPQSFDKWTACQLIMRYAGEFKERVDYDWATYDAFPAFRGDFRPLADTMDSLADPDPFQCDGQTSFHIVSIWPFSGILKIFASLARNFPFMNTNVEQTRTIGHLDPTRPPFGILIDEKSQAATWYGTTHELIVNAIQQQGTYSNAANADLSECAVVDNWLWEARARRLKEKNNFGNGWDSGYSHIRNGRVIALAPNANLTPVRPRPTEKEGHVESQFRHGFNSSGMGPIVAANDPLWNIRAYDTALWEHSGYISYPFICAIDQLVMDDVASKPSVSAVAAPSLQ